RDIDVAHGETLPPLQAAYVAGDAARARAWQSLEQGLAQAAIQGREAVRKALHRPAVGASLLELTAWLETLDGPGAPSLPEGRAPAPSAKAVRRWTRQRLVRLHTQWTEALRDGGHPEGLHRARILAKRLRYNIEALAPLLPARVQRWQQQASQWQTDLGTTRDVLQAGALAQRLGAEPGLVQFLRGFAAGREGLPRSQGVPGGV
ncbi:MAG: CHAD domain-containing protein, partial [Burkholderiaceae bacterium]|nr:CHAD domain-containing protein [Burkholderiaceae bacterium]